LPHGAYPDGQANPEVVDANIPTAIKIENAMRRIITSNIENYNAGSTRRA
jgi:hypothetical protein